jgi:hypothetical protein
MREEILDTASARAGLDELEGAVLARLQPLLQLPIGRGVVAHALIEIAGSALQGIVTAHPELLPEIDSKLAMLRLYVSATGQRAQ